jgi:hypothetical protein
VAGEGSAFVKKSHTCFFRERPSNPSLTPQLPSIAATFVSTMDHPTGLAVHDDVLFVAEQVRFYLVPI